MASKSRRNEILRHIKMLWRYSWYAGKIVFFSKHSYIIYHFESLSLLTIFYYETLIWKSVEKKCLTFSWDLWWEKIYSTEPLKSFFSKDAQIINHFVCWSSFIKTLWLQNGRYKTLLRYFWLAVTLYTIIITHHNTVTLYLTQKVVHYWWFFIERL